MGRLAGLTVALVLASGCAAPSMPAARDTATDVVSDGGPDGVVGQPVSLERLIDGDSMELAIDGAVVEVRLIGVNAPELRTVDGVGSCNGREARRAMEDLVGRGELRYVAGERDRFDRVLGVLWAGPLNLNRALVDEGWALGLWSAEDAGLVEAMVAAASAGRGMWGDTCGAPEAELVVSDHQLDAPGRDEEHLDDEWVEITNPSVEPVELAGWSVADETTSNRFPLPPLELGPGRQLLIRTGDGRSDGLVDGPEVHHLGQDQPVWNNRGETILVLDPDGRIAAHAFVP